jgi:hypothetical protein
VPAVAAAFVIPAIVAAVITVVIAVIPALALFRMGWRPVSRILPGNCGMVIGRGIVEIHPHRGGGQQDINGNAAGLRS